MLSSAYTQQKEITICENNSANFMAFGHLQLSDVGCSALVYLWFGGAILRSKNFILHSNSIRKKCNKWYFC